MMVRYEKFLRNKIMRNDEVIDAIRNLDPYKWLDTRDFPPMKVADYLKTIECELRSSTVKHGCYETMVKSGEVYFD